MNKSANNKDFEEIFQLYTESYHGKVEDDKEPEEDEVVEEEEDCEECEEDKQLEEGFFDRMKAKASGVKGTAGAVAGNVKNAVGGLGRDVKYRTMGGERPNETKDQKPKDVGSQYQDKKTHSILSSHMVKLDKALSGLASDVVELGVMDADQAEELANNISIQIRKNFVKHNKGKGFTAKGQNFQHSDAAAKYQK
jgi:hypothetical protein